MKVKVDGKEYAVLGEDELTNAEVIAIEKATGDVITTWAQGSMSLITGLVWVTIKRENPQLKFQDVVFSMADLTVDEADEEEEEVGKDKARKSEPTNKK